MKTLILGLLLISANLSAQNFYSELNEYRKRHFLRPLEVDSMLEIESKIQINKIINRWHGGLVHGSVNDKNHKFKTEVLNKNCESDLICWLESPPHKKAILSRKARKIGYAKINNIACARLTD